MNAAGPTHDRPIISGIRRRRAEPSDAARIARSSLRDLRSPPCIPTGIGTRAPGTWLALGGGWRGRLRSRRATHAEDREMRRLVLLAMVSLFTIAQVGVARAQVAFVQEGTLRNLIRGNEPAAAAAFPAPPKGSNLAYGTFLVDLSGDGWLDAVMV